MVAGKQVQIIRWKKGGTSATKGLLRVDDGAMWTWNEAVGKTGGTKFDLQDGEGRTNVGEAGE